MSPISPSPIRVLVNAVHARAGGGVTYLRHLLPLLAAEPDIELHLIPHPSQARTFAAPGIRLHPVRLPGGWAALLLWEQAMLPLLARRIGCDLLFSAANFGPLLLRAQVVVVQNAVTAGAGESRIAKRLYWSLLHGMTALSLCRARGAIAVSRYTAEAAAVPLLRRRPPTIVPLGVGAFFSPDPSGAPREDFLLAVGDLYFHKNFHRLIDALAELRRRRPGVTLRIAGADIDADYAGSLRRRIAELGLAESVHLLGRQPPEELLRLYRRCAAFILPSTAESFPMPLVEAMACGAPVIAANCAAMPEISADAALLCDPRSPPDIAAAIERVLGDPALAADLRRRGIERARAFSWEACARRTAAVLREAAGRRAMPCAA